MKIKLRDITIEQYEEWLKNNCATKTLCGDCPFFKVFCCDKNRCWVNNKELYSDKFLDQEIEIEDEPLIDKQTQDYLEKINKDYDVTHVRKGSDYIRFFADIDGEWEINFYCSKKAKIYNDFRNLKTGKDYLIKDLIQSKNDILTLEERQYLRAVIKPFRKRVVGIAKMSYRTLGEKIVIIFENFENLMLPIFKPGTMYKRMKLDTPYTLEDLGL